MSKLLEYERPARQPPRKPVAWLVSVLIGATLIFIRFLGRASNELIEIAWLIAGLVLTLAGGLGLLEYHSRVQDFHYRASRDRSETN